MISLKQLNYALAVARTKHFKQASEQCFVSQSTLSSAIAELESQLGVQIFERDNKRVLITALGEQILTRAGQVLAQVKDIEQLASASHGVLQQPMKLGCIPTIGPYLLPKVLPPLRQQFSNFELTLVEEQSATLVEQVRSGELDAAVIALPFPCQGLLSFDVWQEDFYALFHQEHPLASLSQVNHQSLNDSALLLLREGHCLTDHALAVCQLTTGAQNSNLEGTSLFTLVQMVAGKMGTTLIPQMALDNFLSSNPELRAQRLNEPGPHRKIAFIVRPNYARLADIEQLKQLFIKALEQNV